MKLEFSGSKFNPVEGVNTNRLIGPLSDSLQHIQCVECVDLECGYVSVKLK